MHPQEGGPKVTEGAPYFRYIGTWGPHIYCKIRAGRLHLKGPPIFYDTGLLWRNCLGASMEEDVTMFSN